jgi:hypothetical protein
MRGGLRGEGVGCVWGGWLRMGGLVAYGGWVALRMGGGLRMVGGLGIKLQRFLNLRYWSSGGET